MATGCTVVVCRYLAVASWRLSQVQISTERRSIATAASDAGAACAPPASTSPRPWHTHPRALTAFLHINPGHPDYLFTAPRSSFVLSYICFRHITFRSPILRKGPPIRLQSMFVLLFFLYYYVFFLYASEVFGIIHFTCWNRLAVFWNEKEGYDKSKMNDLCVIECSLCGSLISMIMVSQPSWLAFDVYFVQFAKNAT